MATVFTDEVGTYDLTITTGADWTTQSGSMPNGDNAHSLSTTLNQNANWNGEEFCLPNGSGSEARTLEAWVKVTANTNIRLIWQVRTDGTANTTTNRHVNVYITAAEAVEWAWFNTAAGLYLTGTTSALSAGWHYIVLVFRCGSSRATVCYVDCVQAAADTTTTGTATYATSDAYQLFVGTDRATTDREMTDHMGKVAWYERELTRAEMFKHYTAMVAT